MYTLQWIADMPPPKKVLLLMARSGPRLIKLPSTTPPVPKGHLGWFICSVQVTRVPNTRTTLRVACEGKGRICALSSS